MMHRDYDMMRMESSFDNSYWLEKYPTKEYLKQKAAGGPGPSEKRRQVLRKKRRK